MIRSAFLIGAVALAMAVPLDAQGRLSVRLGHRRPVCVTSQRVPVQRPVVRTVRRYRGHHHHGHRQVVRHRVWVRGHYDTVYVPARYRWVTDSCGRRRRVLVEPAHHERVWVPGRWVYRRR